MRHPSIEGLDMRKTDNRPSWYPLLNRPPSEVRSMVPDEWKEWSDAELYAQCLRFKNEILALNKEPQTKEVRKLKKQTAVKWDLIGDFIVLRRSDKMGLPL